MPPLIEHMAGVDANIPTGDLRRVEARDGYQQMIADAEQRSFDIIVSEALDRIGRKLSDVAELHDQLQFLGIPLHAVKLGEVTTLHVGLLGTMAQLYLSDLRDKTKRGQLGRALAGKIPGGQAYGYAWLTVRPASGGSRSKRRRSCKANPQRLRCRQVAAFDCSRP